MKCAHCAAPNADNLWHAQLCADSRRKRKKRLCDACDVELNRMVLEFMGDAKASEKMAAYEANGRRWKEAA